MKLFDNLPKGSDKGIICVLSAYFIRLFTDCELQIDDTTSWLLAAPLAMLGILIPSNIKVREFVDEHEDALIIGIPAIYILVIGILFHQQMSRRYSTMRKTPYNM